MPWFGPPGLGHSKVPEALALVTQRAGECACGLAQRGRNPSVPAMVETGLRAAGYRTGRYTSPHLINLRERFAIDGRAIDDETMIAAVGEVRAVVESLLRNRVLEVQPTFFEVTTAVAFELFRRSQIGFAIVEVGLGGRLDATNVLSPAACAITSIAFDHQLYLGSTLREIALEKAGIIKPGVPVVVGALHAEALSAIAEVARARNAPLVQASLSDVAGITKGSRSFLSSSNVGLQSVQYSNKMVRPARPAGESPGHI